MKQFLKTILNFFKDNWFKAGIIIAIVICGGFIYQSQINKQESIEWQQQIELRAKTEQANKEYVANQKKACLEIYQVEAKKWSNVASWNYDDYADKCEITYNLSVSEKKSKATCEKDYAESQEIYKSGTIPSYVFSSYLHCLDGTFTKEF